MPRETEKNQVQQDSPGHPEGHYLAEQCSENLDRRKKPLVMSPRKRRVNKDSNAELVAQKDRSRQNENQKQDLHLARSLSEGPEKARRFESKANRRFSEAFLRGRTVFLVGVSKSGSRMRQVTLESIERDAHSQETKGDTIEINLYLMTGVDLR
jgi:hypothetical protein